MKESPIPFTGEMVRAVLAGRKTQTRRVIKPQPPGDATKAWILCAGHWYCDSDQRGSIGYCPYGQPGDRLWVRETWAPDPPDDGTWSYTAWAGCREGRIAGVPERFRKPRHCIYSATWAHGPLVWTSSALMPRWASRITLEITGVRVERLNSISDADALAEGTKAGDYWPGASEEPATARDAYRDLWDSINGKRPGCAWADNPWVWAVEFRRVGAPCSPA